MYTFNNNNNNETNCPVEIPIGLGRTPFQFKAGQDTAWQLKKIRVISRRVSKGKPIETNNSAEIPQLLSIDPTRNYFHEIHEEIMWVPPKNPFNYELCHNRYWRAIWRQFEGHIPYTRALQNLRKYNYSVLNSLESIDQLLKKLRQQLNPVCKAQYNHYCQIINLTKMKHGYRSMKYLKLIDKLRETHLARRMLQLKVLRNYHIEEINNLYYKFKEYNNLKEYNGCFCNEPLLEPLVFEPRWACFNCTKTLERRATIPENKLCLICQTFLEIGGETRPADDPIFSDLELVKIENWFQMEKQEQRLISREEFEDSEMKKTQFRQSKNKLLDEEIDMLSPELLPFDRTTILTESEQCELGKSLVEQLTAAHIPHCIKCERFHQEKYPVVNTEQDGSIEPFPAKRAKMGS